MPSPTGKRARPPDGTCKLVYSGTNFGMTWAMVLWVRLVSSAPAAADLATVLSAWRLAFTANFVPTMSNQCALTQTLGVWVIPGGGEIVQYNTTASTGGAANPLLNAATCAVINWRIDKYYRGGKPRSYLPGLLAADVTDGVHLTSSKLTSLQTGAAAWRTAVNAATAGAITQSELGTVSFAKDGAYRATPEFWPYLGVTVRPTLGTQRRRLLA